jgi:hypothetical protein
MVLTNGRRRLKSLHDIHPACDATEHGEALAIGVAASTKVHLRLIANDDRERGRRRVRSAPRHRQRAVNVSQSRRCGAFKRNRRKLIAASRLVDLKLNHLDLDVVPHGVVGADRAIDAAAVVEAGIDILQEVGGGGRRVHAVDLHLNRPLLGIEDNDHAPLHVRGL